MSRLPALDARKLSKALNKLGFNLIKQQGSHMFFEHPDGRTTIVPNHQGEDIDRGLLNKIIKRDLRISRDEFLELL